jgi:hypothetical protein
VSEIKPRLLGHPAHNLATIPTMLSQNSHYSIVEISLHYPLNLKIPVLQYANPLFLLLLKYVTVHFTPPNFHFTIKKLANVQPLCHLCHSAFEHQCIGVLSFPYFLELLCDNYAKRIPNQFCAVSVLNFSPTFQKSLFSTCNS